MTFEQIFVEYILPAIGTAFGGLLTWGVTELILLIKKKVKNQALANALTEITELADTTVRATYQTYVQGLKGTDLWTEEAQKTALNMALKTMTTQLSKNTMKWIENNADNVEEYLINIIESAINKNKKS